MNRTVTINGVELYFSATDVDFMKLLGDEEDKFREAVASSERDDEVETLEVQIGAGFALFDGVYGEGTAEKLFPKRDMSLIFEAYKLLIDEGKAQSEEYTTLLEGIFSGGDDEPFN